YTSMIGLGKWKNISENFNWKDICSVHNIVIPNVPLDDVDNIKSKSKYLIDRNPIKIKGKKHIENKNLDDEQNKDKASMLYDLRKSAECHRLVRKNVQNFIKPGVKILDICNKIENDIVKYMGENSLKSGIAFPTGVSLNNVISHDTANPGDTRVLN